MKFLAVFLFLTIVTANTALAESCKNYHLWEALPLTTGNSFFFDLQKRKHQETVVLKSTARPEKTNFKAFVVRDKKIKEKDPESQILRLAKLYTSNKICTFGGVDYREQLQVLDQKTGILIKQDFTIEKRRRVTLGACVDPDLAKQYRKDFNLC